MVAESEGRIISGPKDNSGIPVEPIGKLLFERLKKADKNRIAVVNGSSGVKLCYGEIFEQSVKLALHLKESGLQKTDILTIISENVATYCIPMLAAFYLGVTVNCLNPGYTVGELQHILDPIRPKMVFCSRNVEKTIKQLLEQTKYDTTVIVFGESKEQGDILDMQSEVTENIDNFTPETVDLSEAVALILSSSGTTGLPKNVLIPHQALRYIIVNTCNEDYGHMSSDSVTSLVVPMFHLLGSIIHVSSLYSHANVVMLTKFHSDTYLSTIKRNKISILYVVPSIMNFLAKTPLVNQFDVNSVRDIVCAGAPLSRSTEAIIKKRFRLAVVRQLYGMTEIGCGCILQPWGNGNKPGSVGKLLFDFQAKICDPTGSTILSANKVGELRIKGPTLMKGYLKREKESKDAFDEDGFLRTGDAMYYDEDEYFYVVDRFKEMIKYKGFQVSPAELEAVLSAHPGVKECAVVPKPDERAGEVPIAFVVKQENNTVTEDDLVQLVAENLSIQKRLYGGVIFVNELPKNAFGKILRRRLKLKAATLVE